MSFTAWKYKEMKRHRDRQKYVFTTTSGGFVIEVGNNSLNDGK